MRRAYQDVDFIGDEEKKYIIGISLGYDYCAEHEWGIKGIKSKLGMPSELNPKNFGLAFRTMTKLDEKALKFFKVEKTVAEKDYSFACLILEDGWYNFGPERMPRDLENFQDMMIPSKWDKEGKTIITAWDEGGFGIVVRDEKNVKYLEEIYDAFNKKDICIGLFGGGPFANAHLTIAIKSRMPDDAEKDLKKSDMESFEISKIRAIWEEKAKKAGKESFKDFMCISPRFFAFNDKEKETEQMKKIGTKYNFHIWINASNDNYGWYTGEQVEKWFKSDKQLKEFKI